MRKVCKSVLYLLVFLMILSFVRPEMTGVQAASKKTVRVATEKQLKSALEDPKADVIVFRSGTYKAVTIKSNKAKDKKIIIDAPNAVITNTARFKTIELQNVKKYIEAVSGNTIKAFAGCMTEAAEGCRVKKLVLTEPLTEYSVLRNASVKNVVIADKEHRSVFDKKTRTLTFETTGLWTSYSLDYYGEEEEPVTQEYPIYYTATLDGSGRTLCASYTGWACDLRYEYIYDENGRRVELKQYNEATGVLELTRYYEYDNLGNLTVERLVHSDEVLSSECKYSYDENGRMNRTVESGKYYMEETGYVYDDNGLLTRKETTKFGLEDDRISNRKSWVNTYTYNKNGFLLNEEDKYTDEHFSYLYTYEYDKAGNMIHEIYTYENKGFEKTAEYSYEYDKLGRMTRKII